MDKKYLIILGGSPRGGEKAWNSLYKFVKNNLDADLAKWIVKSAKTSMFNDNRCYVYNKAVIRYLKNRKDQLPFPEANGTWKPELATDDEVVFYFEKIRVFKAGFTP